MKKGILFDLDGVLVDSMPYHLKAWQWIFNEKGVKVDIRTLALNEGRRSAEMAEIIAKNGGVVLDDAEIQDIILGKRAYYRKIADVDFFPGALDTVHKLRQQNKICAIVTSCIRKSLETAIPAHQIKLFDYTISGDELKRGKPNPDPFITASDKLGLVPDDCIVIENAPLGIRSAKAAGMLCIAITSTLNRDDLAEADYIIDDISKIIPIIDSL